MHLRTRRHIPIGFMVILCFLFQHSFIYAQPTQDSIQVIHGYVPAIVLEIVSDEIEENMRYQDIRLQILEGVYADQTLSLSHTINMSSIYQYNYTPGDKVLLSIQYMPGDNEPKGIIYDYLRYQNLLYIVLLFFACLLLIGGKQGLKSVITLCFTCFCIIKIYIPMILQGYDPIPTAILICASVIIVSFFIISGYNKKTLAAICGTIGGVAIAGCLAYFVGNSIHLRGIQSEEVELLSYSVHSSSIDFTGVLFGGIIMGALGAVMDVSMSIASSMSEIEITNPRITTLQLIQSGMNIGRDIMGTMSNTLILAYLGGSINLILVFLVYNESLLAFVNMDPIASEVVRAMAGSIGLILTIPLTALIKALLREPPIRKSRSYSSR